jgi:hypothetical protein
VSTPSYPIYLKFILILSTSIPQSTKWFYTLLFFHQKPSMHLFSQPIHSTFPAHIFLHDLMARIMFDMECILWGSSLGSVIQSPLTFLITQCYKVSCYFPHYAVLSSLLLPSSLRSVIQSPVTFLITQCYPVSCYFPHYAVLSSLLLLSSQVRILQRKRFFKSSKLLNRFRLNLEIALNITVFFSFWSNKTSSATWRSQHITDY